MKEYNINCWHCGAPFNAYEASFCSHQDSTKVCPFCLTCFCDASQEYKKDFVKNSPKEILEEQVMKMQGGSFKLGELLMKAGKITQAQLDMVMAEQRRTDQQLGEILVNLGILSQKDLHIFLADQKEMDEYKFDDEFQLNLSLVEKLGNHYCLKYSFVPIELVVNDTEKILRLVVASREDFKKLKQSRRLKKLLLIPMLASKEKVDELLNQIRENDIFILS